MADAAGKLAAILRLKQLKANPSPLMHAELEKLNREHPWLLDWDRYVPLKKREGDLRKTATEDASKANVIAQNAAVTDLSTLEDLEQKYPEFKLAFPLYGGRRRTGRGRRARGRRRNTRRH